jgi:hypothetical protein
MRQLGHFIDSPPWFKVSILTLIYSGFLVVEDYRNCVCEHFHNRHGLLHVGDRGLSEGHGVAFGALVAQGILQLPPRNWTEKGEKSTDGFPPESRLQILLSFAQRSLLCDGGCLPLDFLTRSHSPMLQQTSIGVGRPPKSLSAEAII